MDGGRDRTMIRLFELSRGRDFGGSPDAMRRLRLDFHCDFFATISLCGLVLVGAPSWRSFAVAGAIGIVIDVVRHIFSPECRMPVSQIADLIEAGIADTPDFKQKLRRYKRMESVIPAVWLAFPWLAISLAARWSGKVGPSWLALPFRVSEFNYNISSFGQRAVSELLDHGYAWRAEFISLIYFGNLFFFVTWGIVLFSGYEFFKSVRQIEITKWSFERTSISSVVFFALGLLAHGLMNFFTISWSGKNIGFYLDMVGRDEGITAFCLAEGGATFLLTFSYQCAVTARIMVIRNDRAHRSKKSTSDSKSANTVTDKQE